MDNGIPIFPAGVLKIYQNPNPPIIPDIDDFDYSETMARFKVVKEMENRGMKGLLSSYGPNGRPKHYKFKTSTIGRQKKNTQNKKTKNIPEQESLIKQLSKSSFFYEKYLRHL